MPGRTLLVGIWAFIILGGFGTAGYFLLGPGPGSAPARHTSRDTAFHPAPAPPLSTQNPATVASITHDWQTFFDPATPVAKRERLLQHGSRFRSVLLAYSRSDEGSHTVVSVDAVKAHGYAAVVKYSVFVHQVLEMNQVSGNAVRSGGTWQVSDTSFCRVLSYEQIHTPACAGSS